MLRLYLLWFIVGIVSAVVLILDGWWQPNFKKWFLTTSATIRELVQHENSPKFHIDRRVAQWACHSGAILLILLGVAQNTVFVGSYKALLYPVPYFLLAYILSSYDAKGFQKGFEISERGYQAEKKINEILLLFVHQEKGDISQPRRREKKRWEDIDRFVFIPSSKTGFAISVKNLGCKGEKVKVSFDVKRKRFRYRRGRRGIEDFPKDPTLDHKERVFRFSSDGSIPSCRNLHLILVFPPHVQLKVHQDSPVEVIGKHQFLKLNDVWVVISDQGLAPLIESLHHAQGGD
jgi:hypothetical protein